VAHKKIRTTICVIDTIKGRLLFVYTDGLKAEVEQHRNGAEPNDDLTMMCIFYSGKI